MKTELKKGINWVGYVDWTVRDFHGYQTGRGSTYNAYLVQDEKTALVDTVKAPYADDLLEHVRAFTDPAAIDYLVCNHAEPDHSSSLPRLIDACPNATVVCNEKCHAALHRHFDLSRATFRVVADGESLSLGKRTLTFYETPMVHWPESMFTYIPEEKLLISMDAFGQHYASSHRFDDEEPLDVVMQEAKTYYANILMLYGRPITNALQKAARLDIDMVAPSHGVIWRSHFDRILSAYQNWVQCKPVRKVLVIYDTMWQSTDRMAHAILAGATRSDVDARLLNVRSTHITEIATEMLDAAAVAVGSPTLNMTLMPHVACALAYLQGLRPTGKAGFAFGSYGWAPSGAKAVENSLKEMKIELLSGPLTSQFAPTEEVLAACYAAGKVLAERAVTMTA